MSNLSKILCPIYLQVSDWSDKKLNTIPDTKIYVVYFFNFQGQVPQT